MKILEQSQAKLATQYNSMPWLFFIGWCCHLLSIVTLLVLSGIATDMTNENLLDQYKSLPQLEEADWKDNKAFVVKRH